MKSLRLISVLTAVFLARVLFAQAPAQRVCDQLLIQAVNLYDTRHLQEAYNLLKQAEQLCPENDAVQYYLGNVFALTGDSSKALKHYTRAYQLDSANVWYGNRLAAVYNATHRPADALSLLERLLVRRPNDTEIMSSAMEAYLMTADFEKADSLLTRLELMNGESDFTRLSRLEILRQKGDFREFFSGMNDYMKDGGIAPSDKVDMIRKVMQSCDPRFNFAHLDDYSTLTESCLASHPADTSVIHFAVGMFYTTERKDKILELCREHEDDLYMLRVAASLHMERKDYRACLEQADKMMALKGLDARDYASAHSLKGDCYQYMDHPERSFKEYEESLKLDPDDLTVMNNYAYYMACMGRKLTKCARMSRKTVEAEPENKTYLDTYAWILYKQKKYKAAKTYMKKALLYGGKDSAEVLDHYACILEALGDETLARAYHQQAEYKRNAKK